MAAKALEVAPKVLDNIRKGLLLPLDGDIQSSTCKLLRALIWHESTVQAVVAIVSREDIVALLRDGILDATLVVLHPPPRA